MARPWATLMRGAGREGGELCDLLLPAGVVLLPASAGGGFGGDEGAVPVAVPDDLASVRVDLDDRGGDALEEEAVVGDREDGAGVGEQGVFQPAEGCRVEMVGRFIEEHDLGRCGDQAGESQSGLFASGQTAE